MNAEFIISATAGFTKAIQRLSKTYPSRRNDLVELRTQLQNAPQSGTPLGKDCYKIRLKIASENTGKSGGGRVVTYVKIEAKRITLLTVYDKPEKENITGKELAELLKEVED